MTIKAGSTVKSEENDYTTYTVLKSYVNKKDNQNYLNILSTSVRGESHKLIAIALRVPLVTGVTACN